MPENLSPEGADEISQGSDELTASKRTNSGGGYSPHSTTGTTGTTTASRKRAVTSQEEEEEEDETEDDDPTLLVPRVSSESDSVERAGPAINPTPLKQVLVAAIKLSGSISRQHSERTLQIVTDLLVSRPLPIFRISIKKSMIWPASISDGTDGPSALGLSGYRDFYTQTWAAANSWAQLHGRLMPDPFLSILAGYVYHYDYTSITRD